MASTAKDVSRTRFSRVPYNSWCHFDGTLGYITIGNKFEEVSERENTLVLHRDEVRRSSYPKNQTSAGLGCVSRASACGRRRHTGCHAHDFPSTLRRHAPTAARLRTGCTQRAVRSIDSRRYTEEYDPPSTIYTSNQPSCSTRHPLKLSLSCRRSHWSS